MRVFIRMWIVASLAVVAMAPLGDAQQFQHSPQAPQGAVGHSSAASPGLDQPMTRIRPIGAPSAVDSFAPRGLVETASVQRTASVNPMAPPTSGGVQQAVFLQSDSGAMTMPLQGAPSGSFIYPPENYSIQPPALSAPPLQHDPRAVPPSAPWPGATGSGAVTSQPLSVPPSLSQPTTQPWQNAPLQPQTVHPQTTMPLQPGAAQHDLMPVAPPQLSGSWANVNNSAHVSAPSLWQASYVDCAPMAAPAFPPPPVLVPPTMMPGAVATPDAGWRPLLNLSRENYNVQLGRGVLGQPTAYVPGQPVRNFIRYLSP
jgi:hypothetical protein